MKKIGKIFFILFTVLGAAFLLIGGNGQKPPAGAESSMAGFKSLVPNLMVEEMDKTIDFYREVLGFELLMTAPETAPFDWAMMKNGAVTVMFQTRKSLSEELPAFREKAAGGALTLYVDVDNVKNLYEKLKGKTVVKKEIFETFYGTKEFVIQDINGFIIVFAEDTGSE